MRVMYKIAVIGSSESVIGFRALGLETYAVESGEEAKRVLQELGKQEEYAIIYMEETAAMEIEEEIRKYDEQPRPAIILIPGRNGAKGIGRGAMDEAIRKAIGTEIM